MGLIIKNLPFGEDLLSRMATDLLGLSQESGPEKLASALVVLPSARACRTLGHRLLEKSGQEALLLPRVLTPRQLFEEAAVAHGVDAIPVPDEATRAMILAPHLARLPWLQETPENAPGLAAEFLAVFDELRLQGRADLLEGDAAVAKVQAAGPEGAAEVLAGDTRRLAEVWHVYRGVVPRDAIDVQVEAAASVREGRSISRLVVAGFGRLNQVQAQLLHQLLPCSREAVLYLPEADDLLSRFFVTTWGEGGTHLDPMAPSRELVERLCPEVQVEMGGGSAGTLRQRLDGLGDLSALYAPDGPLETVVCRDQEEESRLVAHRVVQILQQPQGAQQSIAVLTNDPVLAERIVAQLRDAGVDVDNTLGRPLAGLPAGLLLRFMLRTALTGLRPEYLLEVLTHPDVQVGAVDGVSRERAVLNLERMLRAQDHAPTGSEGLLRLARQRDESASAVSGAATHQAEEFMTAVTDAFQPLREVATGARPVAELLAAMRQSWQLLASDTPLEETRARPDVTAVDQLLDRLQQDQAWLPPATLVGLAADLTRLMTAANIAPHRTEGLPVLVAGLVEARLERYDHLIMAGLNEGKFPTRSPRPLFFDATTRRHLELPTWRDSLARDAELFLRLLHNAPRVLLTWSRDEGDRPLLPSPFVERLLLGRPGGHEGLGVEDVPLWRREEVPVTAIADAQASFAAEPLDVPVLAAARRLTSLSWTALRSWRDCPYRFLLERGFALRKSEEVQEEFGRRDVGNVIHRVMRDFLQPGAEGQAALDRQDGGGAEKILGDLARREFAQDGDSLPGRTLWLHSFLNWVPQVVAVELDRFPRWRPSLLEAKFQLPLEKLSTWVGRQDPDQAAPALTESQRAIILEGAIDRVDMARDGEACCVIDYKTGTLPAAKQVKDLKDLQLLLYALAVECGAVGDDAYPRPVGEAAFYGISAKQIGPPDKPTFDGERELLIAAARELVDLAVQAAAPAGPYPLLQEERRGDGVATLPCRYCDFRGACRLEEREGLPSETQVKIDKLVGQKEGGLF